MWGSASTTQRPSGMRCRRSPTMVTTTDVLLWCCRGRSGEKPTVNGTSALASLGRVSRPESLAQGEP
jgi:hypothetical protein